MPLATLAEVEALVRNRAHESITLDYKSDFTDNLEKAKKELAKDVAAFANSQGGLIILGVAEDKQTHDPVWPLKGVPGVLDTGQKTVDWIEQSLNQNIAQRVALTIRSFNLNDSDRAIIVIDVPMSPRAPHMVTYQQDNRYYRRYFKRHQFESLPAEEYEVREMFQRSLRFADEVNALLRERGYLDRTDDDFAHNPLTQQLSDRRDAARRAATFVSYVAVPNVLVPDAVNFEDAELRQRLDVACRQSHPIPGGLNLHSVSRFTFDGLLFVDRAPQESDVPVGWENFLFLGRNGYVEYATSRFAGANNEGRTFVALTPTVGRFWAFASFVCELYHRTGLTGSFRLLCNITNTLNSYIAYFGEGWRDTYYEYDAFRRVASLDRHIQVVHELPNPDLDEQEIENLVRRTDARIENAYGWDGSAGPRSFNHPSARSEKAGQFAFGQYRGWCLR